MTGLDPIDGEFRGEEPVEDPGSRAYLLLASVVCLVASGVVFILGSPGWHAGGYAFASIGAFTFTGVYRRSATGRESLTGITAQRYLTSIATSSLVAGFVLASLHAWYLARTIA